MEKDYYRILDAQLDRIHQQQLERENPPKHILQKAIDDMQFRDKHKVRNFELDEMDFKLINDGYIRNINPPHLDPYYNITFKGYVFIQSGKYSNENRMVSRERRYQALVNFSLIFGGLLAGAYYIAELVSFFRPPNH